MVVAVGVLCAGLAYPLGTLGTLPAMERVAEGRGKGGKRGSETVALIGEQAEREVGAGGKVPEGGKLPDEGKRLGDLKEGKKPVQMKEGKRLFYHLWIGVWTVSGSCSAILAGAAMDYLPLWGIATCTAGVQLVGLGVVLLVWGTG